ncbi:uncharacterized protein LOC134202526 [Armigeres subalbatus]|uniref:uncharacterized protein LOC134202526 n=1 Tax=Armigeres subalbatus TaxID=124917 RepID=UPI002ED5452B
MADRQQEMENLQQETSNGEINLSVDLVNLLNRYGVQFADASSVGSFLSQLGITSDIGTETQVISATEDAFSDDQNPVDESSQLQSYSGEVEEENFIDTGESTIECPIDGDSSGVNSIPSSNQRSPDVENSIGSSEANRARVEKESQEESFLAPNSSRLLSLKVEIADEPATEEDINPPSAINSSELETEADAEVSKDTTTVTQNKPDSSSIKENASPNVNASAGIGPVESNGGVELTPKLLLEILQHSIIGQDIIARASKGVLSDGRQLELAQIIAEWHLEHRKKLYEDNLKSYAKTITLLFRNEKLVS